MVGIEEIVGSPTERGPPETHLTNEEEFQVYVSQIDTFRRIESYYNVVFTDAFPNRQTEIDFQTWQIHDCCSQYVMNIHITQNESYALLSTSSRSWRSHTHDIGVWEYSVQ